MKNKLLAALLVLSVSYFTACSSDSGGDSETTRVNTQPFFLSSAPTVAQIGIQYTYNVSVMDVDTPSNELTIVTNIYDTCLGNFDYNGDGEGVYTFTPDAAQVGADCDVGFTASDGKINTDQVSTVHIGDTNAAPYFTSTAPATATEDTLYTYDITVADDNIPAQVLTITEGALNTCGGTVIDDGDGTGSYSFTPDENDGGGNCLLSLTVTDSMGESVDQNTIITINEDNKAPSFTSSAPTTATEGVSYNYSATVADPDSPAQTLTCSINGSDTCGGALTGCAYTFTPSETQGGTTCVVGLNVSDGALSADQNSVVTIAEANQAPVWSSAPANLSVVTGQTYNSTNGTATDADLPGQTLTCSSVGSTCSFTVTVSGSGTSPRNCAMSFTAGANPETCGVNVQVSDGAGGTITQSIMISVQQCRKFVDDDATGTGDGSSWTNAFTVIKDAVDASWSGCEIWVAEGDYFKKTAGTGNVLTMKSGVDIYGGFIGAESDLAERLDPADYPTILDGEDTSYHVVVAASNARLDGFYVTGGNAIGLHPNDKGGGMYNSGPSNLILANNNFIGNSAAFGGGIYSAFSSPTITNCDFYGNSVSSHGGAIFNDASSPTITDCDFFGNSANTRGGAIHNTSSTSPITNCVFSGNSANSGGGIANYSSSPTITNCAFSGNLGSSSNNGFGGGIYNYDSSSPTIANCVFTTNFAFNGGGISNYNSSATITNCLFTGNSAHYGGGMDNDSSSLTISNCTLMGNSGTVGGGIDNYDDTSPAIINCVIWGNTASIYGPSIYNVDATTATPTVSYSDAMGCGGSGAWVAGCGINGGGNIDLIPSFVAGLFGAYYLSQTASGQAGDSPCLNTGNATAAGLGLDTRTTRTDNAPDSGTVDMGYHYPIP